MQKYGNMGRDNTGKDNLHNLYIYLPETDELTGMRMLSPEHHREFCCVERNPQYYLFINFCTLMNIFSA